MSSIRETAEKIVRDFAESWSVSDEAATALIEGEQEQRRACLLCDRDCLIICERGGLTIKEPCPNKCGAGYMKPKVGHVRDN